MAQGLDSQDHTRLALINTNQHKLERYRDHSRRAAERFGLCYKELPWPNTDQKDAARSSGRRVRRRLPWRDHLVPGF